MKCNKASRNVYRLPFNGKMEIRPAPWHHNKSWLRYAVDFALPAGTPILAAKGGKVCLVIDGYENGGSDKKYLDLCNLMMIEHKGGEFSIYVHLRRECLVKEDQNVRTGQKIAYSGVSGQTTYPHLHFQVVSDRVIKKELASIPTRFRIENRIEVLVSQKR